MLNGVQQGWPVPPYHCTITVSLHYTPLKPKTHHDEDITGKRGEWLTPIETSGTTLSLSSLNEAV